MCIHMHANKLTIAYHLDKCTSIWFLFLNCLSFCCILFAIQRKMLICLICAFWTLCENYKTSKFKIQINLKLTISSDVQKVYNLSNNL